MSYFYFDREQNNIAASIKYVTAVNKKYLEYFGFSIISWTYFSYNSWDHFPEEIILSFFITSLKNDALRKLAHDSMIFRCDTESHRYARARSCISPRWNFPSVVRSLYVGENNKLDARSYVRLNGGSRIDRQCNRVPYTLAIFTLSAFRRL